MNHHVVFRHEALQQLKELYDYIADSGSPENAARITDASVTYCAGLSHFPYRGTARLHETVAILGLFYGGRDYEAILAEIGAE